MGDKLKYTVSSGNVFADLGDPAPEESFLKAQLAHRISTEIRDRGLTQEQAAETMGIDQPKVSALVRGRLTNFSVERLLKYVTALGNDVDIVVRPKVATEERGTVQVHDSLYNHKTITTRPAARVRPTLVKRRDVSGLRIRRCKSMVEWPKM